MAHKGSRRAGRYHRKPKAKDPAFVGKVQLGSSSKLYVEHAGYRYPVARYADRGAFHGDEVACSLHSHRSRGPYVKIMRIVKRAQECFAARFERDGALRVLVSLEPHIHHDFFVDPLDDCDQQFDLQDGDIVQARILIYPTSQSFGIATVCEKLEDMDESRIAHDRLKAHYGLTRSFGEEVTTQLAQVEQLWNERSYQGRVDLRGQEVITIDPYDAKDFDDALSCKQHEDGSFTLWVHIADVSHFIAVNSPVDKEAYLRATSTYLCGEVIPMLPEFLSNELCSLKPAEERFAFTVRVELDAQAGIRSYQFFESVIQSSARLNYDEVDEFLAARTEKFAHEDMVLILHKLAQLREELGRQRGVIPFSRSEIRFVLDEEARPLELRLKQATPATKLVEECMLLANECVARFLSQRGVEAAYRIHEAPRPEALEHMLCLMQEFGYDDDALVQGVLSGNPFSLQALLSQAQGREEEKLMSYSLLRCMQQACYKPHNEGHYGLALESYTHFTSPIRRYPDLIVHRALKAQLGIAHYVQQLAELRLGYELMALHCSEQERNAQAAEQESIKLKFAQYMEQFVGKRFAATVVAVESFGLFVELENKAQALLSAKEIERAYKLERRSLQFSHEYRELYCDEWGISYRIGTELEVIIQEVDLTQGYINVMLPPGL